MEFELRDARLLGIDAVGIAQSLIGPVRLAAAAVLMLRHRSDRAGTVIVGTDLVVDHVMPAVGDGEARFGMQESFSRVLNLIT